MLGRERKELNLQHILQNLAFEFKHRESQLKYKISVHAEERVSWSDVDTSHRVKYLNNFTTKKL